MRLSSNVRTQLKIEVWLGVSRSLRVPGVRRSLKAAPVAGEVVLEVC